MKNLKNVIFGSIAAVVVVLILFIVGGYFHYNNKEVALRQQAEAQRGNIEATHDAMWKILQQKAQVTDEYRAAFDSIYPKLIEGRYSQGDGSLMKWIKESNPNFDTSLYMDLMQSIEIERNNFKTSQSRMLDIIREHETLCKTVPAKWFISDDSPIEYKVISSTKTKAVMQTGLDDDTGLFNKK